MCPSRATRTPRDGSTGWARWSSRSRSAASASGSSGARNALKRPDCTHRVGRDRRRHRVTVLMDSRRTPGPPALFAERTSRSSTSRPSSSMRPILGFLQSVYLPGVSTTRAGTRGRVAPGGILLTCSHTRRVVAARVGASRPVVGPGSWRRAWRVAAHPCRAPPCVRTWEAGSGATHVPVRRRGSRGRPLGIGITLVVAPLTTTLMGSVPVANAGLGAAINNAVSRVGQPLLLAVIYLAISALFYATLGDLVPGLDTTSDAARSSLQPLNPPSAGVDPGTAAAVDEASRPPSGRHAHGRRPARRRGGGQRVRLRRGAGPATRTWISGVPPPDRRR